MKWIGVLTVPMLLLTGCASEMAKFQKQAEDHARDGQVDRAEVEDLIGLIDPVSDEFKRFVDDRGAVDTAVVVSYLERYFDKRRSGTGAVDVWRPEQAATTLKFNVNVFVENSVSMDGYVSGELGFKNSIHTLLSGIESTGCDLDLNYINSVVRPRYKNAGATEVAKFTNELTKTAFDENGGYRGSTDLKGIVDTVISRLDGSTTCVIISDFLLSSKKQGASVQDARSMEGAIKDLLKREPNTALLAIHMEAGFDGKYYSMKGPVPIKGKRPYHIWLLGPVAQIESILEVGIIGQLKQAGYKSHWLMKHYGSGCSDAPGYEVAQARSSIHGDFKKGDKTRIVDAVQDGRDGHFGFKVRVDLSGTWQEESFLLDAANYRVQGGYRVVRIERIPIDEGGKYTHLIQLATKEPQSLKDETIVVRLLAQKPEWIAQYSSSDDGGIKSDPLEMERTLWLDDLMTGVSKAFYSSPEPCLASISIPIKKK